MSVEKQIEEVMELVQYLMNAQASSQRIREKKTLESKLRTLLSSAQSGEQAPVIPNGYKLVPITPTPEQLRAGYWSGGGEIRLHEEWARKESYERMVHAAPDIPAPALEVELHPNEVIALANLTGVNVYGPDDYPDQDVIAKLIAFVKAASQPNGEAANG